MNQKLINFIYEIYYYILNLDPHEEKCQFLINKRESAGLTFLNDSKVIKILKNTIQIKNEQFKLF